MSEKYHVKPLNEWRSMQQFVATLKYPEGPAGETQVVLDHQLLSALAEALRLGGWNTYPEPPTVGDLGERKVNAVLSDFERLHYGSWTGPEPGANVLEWLDAWFKPHQEGHMAMRRGQDERERGRVAASEILDQQLAEANETQYRATWNLPPLPETA